MSNFWDFSVWGTFLILGMLLSVLLLANIIKKAVPFLRRSLLPTSVLGGVMILVFVTVYQAITGVNFFDLQVLNEAGEADYVFGRSGGMATLETLTYHCLALGFIASGLKSSKSRISRHRVTEIFNTGVTTVSTYLVQAIVGMLVTLVAAWLFIPGFFEASGILLPFGFGQGTGQALNWGNIYETDWGFTGGRSFGLTVAALGFLFASIGGVIHLNVLRRRGKLGKFSRTDSILHSEDIEDPGEVPMQESIDKMTLQIALIAVAYMMTYGIMLLLGSIEGIRSIVYGFNFLFGVLAASVIKVVMKGLKKVHVIKEEYTNNFLLTRASNLFFDIMVIAGIAAIDLAVLEQYWGVVLALGVAGFLSTYFYNYFVARRLFREYAEEQFMMMYGMLTGTASTGIILLREADPDFKTPAADNMVLQNFPAIVFGFPMMLLANLAPKNFWLTLVILAVFCIAMNLLLFRSFIFKKRGGKADPAPDEDDSAR